MSAIDTHSAVAQTKNSRNHKTTILLKKSPINVPAKAERTIDDKPSALDSIFVITLFA